MGIIDDIYNEMNSEKEPQCDLLRCFECNKTYELDECGIIEDGDWESGIFEIHVCPKDPDHYAEYDMSEEQIERHTKWEIKNGN